MPLPFLSKIQDVPLNYIKEKPISDNLFVSGGIKKVQNCVQVVFEGTLSQINPILIVLMLEIGVSFLASLLLKSGSKKRDTLKKWLLVRKSTFFVLSS